MRIILLLVLLLFPINTFAALRGFCPTSSAFEVMERQFASIGNVFPIRVGGVKVATGPAIQRDRLTSFSSPLCICIRNIGGIPVPLPGITISFYSPVAVMEIVKMPGCFPTLSLELPISGDVGSDGSEDDAGSATYFEAHYVKFNTLEILNLFTDISCSFSPMASGIDLGWMTEFDPTWHDESLSAFLSPENLLFANPIAQLACSADAAANTIGYDIDVLYWCSGGASIFPLSGYAGTTSYLRAASLDSAKMIFKLTRQMILWDTTGMHMVTGSCNARPSIIWEKSNYSQFPLFPGFFPKRFPLGFPDLLWGTLINQPLPKREGFFIFQIYQKRDCCAL